MAGKVEGGRLYRKIADLIGSSGEQGWVYSRSGRGGQVTGITFKQYMAMCLYDPEGGYYQSGAIRIGKQGDFYTSSAHSNIMARLLASYVVRLAREWGTAVRVVEWGGGTGRLGLQMAAEWSKAQAGDQIISYTMVDANPVHLAAFRSGAAEFACHSISLTGLLPEEAAAYPWNGEPAIVIANELVDAFPVHRVVQLEGRLWELGVTVGSSGFEPCVLPAGPGLAASLTLDQVQLAEGQEAEVCLEVEGWLHELEAIVGESAELLIIDYGDEARELVSSHRMDGTLLCYRNHMAHGNPYIWCGEQDITAQVNFTALRRVAAQFGWEAKALQRQNAFLAELGALELLQPHDGTDPFGEAARSNRAIRQLLLGEGMGETFKALRMAKRRSSR